MPDSPYRRFLSVVARFVARARQANAAPRTAVVWRRLGWAVVVATLCWYAGMMTGRMGLFAGGSDSSGYVNNAELLRTGELFAQQRRVEGVEGSLPGYAYVPLGFMPIGQDQMVPTYPLGLSALFVAASCGGPLGPGMTIAMVAMLVGSLVATYALARESGLGQGWAVFCGLALAACPLFQFMTLQVMSDMPALCWTTAALALGLAGRRRRWLAALAGLAVGVSVFIRPSNALVMVPLALTLGLDPRRWLWLATGGLPVAAVWMLANHALFGRFLATGYVNLEGLFGWENVGPSFGNYATSLPWLLPCAVLFILGLPRSRREGAGGAGVATVWVVVVFSFYATYRFTHETWWYLRFVLPAFPALIVLGVRGWREIHFQLAGAADAERGRRWRPWLARVVALGVIAAMFGVQLGAAREREVLEVAAGESVYPETCAWVREHVPGEAVLMTMQASGALFHGTPNTLVRWDQLSTRQLGRVIAAAKRSGHPVYAVLFPFERDQVFEKRLPGRWVQVGAVRDNTIWRLEDPNGAMD